MKETDHTEQFVQLLTGHQSELFAYLSVLVGDLHRAHDVLQNTNLVLWRKAGEFTEGTDFLAWARRVAYFQVLADQRDRRRDRHLFNGELLRQLAERPAVGMSDEDRRLALRACLAELPENRRWLIGERYRPGGSIRDIAQQLGKSEAAIKMMLARVRQSLVSCVRGKMAVEGLS